LFSSEKTKLYCYFSFVLEIKKMEAVVQLPRLIKAGDLLKIHSEDNDEYVELYMHIAKLIEGNREWAIWHPEEVNKMPKAFRQEIYPLRCVGSVSNGGTYYAIQLGYVNGGLYGAGLTINVSKFNVRVIKRVVAKVREADYKVSYTMGNVSNNGWSQGIVTASTGPSVQDFELDERPFSILITL